MSNELEALFTRQVKTRIQYRRTTTVMPDNLHALAASIGGAVDYSNGDKPALITHDDQIGSTRYSIGDHIELQRSGPQNPDRHQIRHRIQDAGWTNADDPDDKIELACAWSDYRADYDIPAGVDPATAHRLFTAGWESHRDGYTRGPIR